MKDDGQYTQHIVSYNLKKNVVNHALIYPKINLYMALCNQHGLLSSRRFDVQYVGTTRTWFPFSPCNAHVVDE
jgi:hypothetical protein